MPRGAMSEGPDAMTRNATTSQAMSEFDHRYNMLIERPSPRKPTSSRPLATGTLDIRT